MKFYDELADVCHLIYENRPASIETSRTRGHCMRQRRPAPLERWRDSVRDDDTLRDTRFTPFGVRKLPDSYAVSIEKLRQQYVRRIDGEFFQPLIVAR